MMDDPRTRGEPSVPTAAVTLRALKVTISAVATVMIFLTTSAWAHVTPPPGGSSFWGGWDPGMNRYCTWTLSPDKPKFWAVWDGCPPSPPVPPFLDGTPHWGISLQSEGHGATCPLPEGQSWEINSSTSPVKSFFYFGAPYRHRMTVDWCSGLQIPCSNPCGSGYYVSLSVGDHRGVGFHPSLATLKTHHHVALFSYKGAFKVSVNAKVGEWGGKKRRLSMLLRPHNFWIGDQFPNDTKMWSRQSNQAGDGDTIMLQSTGWGLPSLCPSGPCQGVLTDVIIDWAAAYNHVLTKNLQGWGNGMGPAPPASTISPDIRFEVEIADQGEIDLDHADFKKF